MPMLTGTPSRSRRNSTTPRYELRQISVSATITWRSQALVTVNWNSTSSSGVARQENVIQRRTGLVRLLVDELAAHAVPGRQIADRRRSRQRLNGQVLAVTPRQHRRCANASIHLAPHLKNVRVPSSALAASTRLRV